MFLYCTKAIKSNSKLMSTKEIKSKLPFEWAILLAPVLSTSKFLNLLTYLNSSTKNIFPPPSEIFTAYHHNDLKSIQVVIVGQDPYHGANQAHGLSFSVKKGNPHPPSLRNIFKEINSDLGLTIPNKLHGDLSHWSKQGVFLINSVLTVEEGNPNSHKGLGWEELTNHTINIISEHNENVVFILWGKFAQQKESLIDSSKHLVIKSAHPSPFSARNGFFGSKPFSKTNEYLIRTNQHPINWEIV